MLSLPPGESGRPALEVAEGVVRRAGEILVARFSKIKEVGLKGRGNLYTDVDLEVEKEVAAFLRREYPHFSLLSEEKASYQGDSGYTWVCDPLDGTRNYVMGIPLFCVNLALSLRGEILLGITFDPLRSELFLAEKGKGAALNGQPISVSSRKTLEESLVGIDMGYSDERAKRALHLLWQLWPGMQSLRVMGSAALGLAYVACGRLDIYFHHYLFPWDIASGILLIREAGGVVTDRDGNPVTLESQGLIAANPALHKDFMSLTQAYDWRG